MNCSFQNEHETGEKLLYLWSCAIKTATSLFLYYFADKIAITALSGDILTRILLDLVIVVSVGVLVLC